MHLTIKKIGSSWRDAEIIDLEGVPRVGDIIAMTDGTVYGVKDVVWEVTADRTQHRIVLHCTRGETEP